MESVSQYLSSAQSYGRNDLVRAAAIAAGAVLLPLFIVAYNDYRFYVSLGPHGMPDNFWGWKRQLSLAPKARKDTTVPAPYDQAEAARAFGPNSADTFLKGPLQARPGGRPEVCGFVAPQRQMTDRCSEDMKRAMNAYLDELVLENPNLLQRENSLLEGPVPAVQIKKGAPIPECLKKTRGELIHVHPPDGSTHLVLSLPDSARVIEQCWGQRHRLSGGPILQWGYTLIYGPRNEEEFALWKQIVSAAARFTTSTVGKVQIP
ncbi:hypothetical protein PFICI_13847 [Pestalotiopsis fici W106-1]|uniref:Luciferase domain-containing protein n=1 Tax=Pestalotiopsis fici (strain W106-1 / CGMCC3.15140) TaxID=1229662 RepID=W3WME0_PESFW|nr:uncharacterized protein PFICI_13847 [Pestalotiopsis fici W106-1]ETS73981.1 hypothetical protein PFICI_13847 [Pestalotiopsis fici W106-1]